MASLREEIWGEVRPEVQEFRLDAVSDGGSISDACHEVASAAIRAREAAALNAEGRMLSVEDLDWMWDQLSALLGAGPMERFLRRSDVENIYVFGPNLAVLGLTGGRQEHVREPVFASEEEMVRYVSHLATTHGQTGRRFDQSAPLLDLRLRSGERIFAAMAVCGTPFLTVRCHRQKAIRIEDLVRSGSLSEQAGDFLRAAVRPPGPSNALVCGALGSGKTTLLRALLAEVGPSEIVCTLEQTFELFLGESHPLTFAVETREANSDGSGEITMEELSKRSLRSGADRVIVGELRGSEAATFLSACGTGSDGSMATIHALVAPPGAEPAGALLPELEYRRVAVGSDPGGRGGDPSGGASARRPPHRVPGREHHLRGHRLRRRPLRDARHLRAAPARRPPDAVRASPQPRGDRAGGGGRPRHVRMGRGRLR